MSNIIVEFIKELPQFIQDWVGFLGAISFLFVIIGFIWIFVIPFIKRRFNSEKGE